MKRILPITIMALCFIAYSCVNENDAGKTSTTEREKRVVMETFTDYASLNQFVDLDVDKHADFVSPDVLQRIQTTNRTKSSATNSAPANLAVIESPDQLPLVREISSKETIYDDGSMESSVIDYLTPAFNPIFEMYETPVDMKKYIYRVDYADGFLKSYNIEGALLLSRPYQMPDMREYVAALDEIITELEAQIEATGQTVPDMSMARAKIGSGRNCNIEKNEQGNIVIEEFILPDASTRSGDNSRVLKIRTEVTPDMKRTIMSTQTEGDQLILRTKYRYSKNNDNFATIIEGSPKCFSENPQMVSIERLVMDDNGYPRIETTQEIYTRNKMIYHKHADK